MLTKYMKLARKTEKTWRNYSKNPKRVAIELKRRKEELERLDEGELLPHEETSRHYLLAGLAGLIHAADTINEPALNLAILNLNRARFALEAGGERYGG